jgi:glycine/D-amino acid oxidase-like deaminating enzyme
LWTAYYLAQQRPELSIAIVEAQSIGFGASGRNGGWLIGGISGEQKILSHLSPSKRKNAYKLLHSIIDEVEHITLKENIQCDLHRGGTIQVAARYPEQVQNLQSQLSAYREQGLTEDDYRWLDRCETLKNVNMHNTYGAIYSPHCAVINPAKLALGLAQSVCSKGVRIFENSQVTEIKNRGLYTAKGSISSQVIVPAIEGFSNNLLHLDRYILPIQSLLIATQPLSEQQWQGI